ncbi:bifunctional UDP-N-acetylmuramoyl-tripeptide:D-alanyl-D-alanine ligase/alanine racemase [Persicitalea jodogahamensis]|uniref:Alanine racemase n=1 Tax=Persicitalea jodogahamensis TaxID=402147 RepID=A0A8J3D596_9BACT|nr:bifunctional UDP-N-acetylmuramoyl-tripeptide:D-alanyl-D-alanine ligase/alanine racemase [Persicitalea jodogahamensis]GHB77249.1 bifunctional UDP-N-acetylmuramoyl-tripeptide:D-alanyl-D-alanine ligase/alanine racemase [Persicitalea jodogahamensis]
MSLIDAQPSEITTQAHYLLTDSRQLSFAARSMFFALTGERHDGHHFLKEVHERGVREFVVEKSSLTPVLKSEMEAWKDATVWVVPDSLKALQNIVARHRAQFTIPIVGITGSNGKTIVKEWLAQLLAPSERVVASPKSYNSQIGVPLSVWNLNDTHSIGLFEAGLSRPHEMEQLEPIIRPTVGIFTNIGSAHDEGFRSRKQKITEKLRLFTHARKLIYRHDYQEVDEEVRLILQRVNPALQTISWGTADSAEVLVRYESLESFTRVSLTGTLGTHQFDTHFRNEAALENLTHCLVFLLDFGLKPDVIQDRIRALRPVSMRLQLKEGIHHSYVIDDTYNNDFQGLVMALNFLGQQENRSRRAVILSDVLQSGRPAEELYGTINQLIIEKKIDLLVGIGPEITRQAGHFKMSEKYFFQSTEAFLQTFPLDKITDSVVLVKGARPFHFEKIVNRLQQKVHGTVLEINLDALTHNLNYYRNKVGSGTKIMVMVKAFAYGSGSAEVANLLQFHRVDYLAVAYADEGVALRQSGITLPIMVMNPDRSTFENLLEYGLEPELYSRRILDEWLSFANNQKEETVFPGVHIKLDTGMHRLGFEENDYDWLAERLSSNPTLRIQSVFSHLVGADEGELNAFSKQQFERFIVGATHLETALGYSFIKHILNSAGIVRFPEYKLDMVRLGIGLYGLEATGQDQRFLQTVGTLKTTISQIKYLKAGQTVGYGRRGQLSRDATIGTIALGYADGYDRGLGNGVGQVSVNGTLCPTIGNVCMDMTMIDLTEANAEESDEVIVFGKEIPITDLAQRVGTIPYEILTGVSERVKRVFFKE